MTYRNPDGTTGTMRTGSKPGSRIALGSENKTVGYDVTYSYDGQESTVRMDDKPGDRLPVIDGQVVTQVAAVDGSNTQGRSSNSALRKSRGRSDPALFSLGPPLARRTGCRSAASADTMGFPPSGPPPWPCLPTICTTSAPC